MNSRQVCIAGGFTVKFNWGFLEMFSFGFLLLFATEAAAQGKAEKDKIRIGYAARAVTHSLPFLAQEAGFFRDEGLQVEVVRTSGAVSPMALLSGDTDFRDHVRVSDDSSRGADAGRRHARRVDALRQYDTGESSGNPQRQRLDWRGHRSAKAGGRIREEREVSAAAPQVESR